MNDLITPIKEELNKEMHKHCKTFMLIGSSNDTPRYYNLKEFCPFDNVLKIGSTQKEGLYFKIDIPLKYNGFEFGEFWKQFKQYRTEFLKTNYPTIKTN